MKLERAKEEKEKEERLMEEKLKEEKIKEEKRKERLREEQEQEEKLGEEELQRERLMEEQLRKDQLKREQEEADLILAQWRKEEKQREEERVLLEAEEERSRAIQAEKAIQAIQVERAIQADKEAGRIERGRQTILARQQRQQEEEVKRRLDVDHKLALVARIVAEETVSRAASQLSVAMHRDENAFVKEEKMEEKIVQTCESEKSKSEVRVAKDLDAEVLRLGIMSPTMPQVKLTLEYIFPAIHTKYNRVNV